MSFELLALKNAAFNDLVANAKVSGNASTTAVFSRLRFAPNIGGTLSIFASDLATEQAADLRAFDYEKGDSAAAGGFGKNTTAKSKHTNVTTKMQAPEGGEARVVGFELLALPPRKPGGINDAATAVQDTDNSSVPTNAGAIGGGAADDGQRFLLQEIADQYVPYVQKAGGKKEYLPPLEWTKADEGNWKARVLFGEGWKWEKGVSLVFGMELQTKKKMPAVAAAAQLVLALNDAFDVTLADGTNCIILQDVAVSTIGARIEPKGS